MPGHHHILKNRRRWLLAALALVCCALIAFTGIVQVAHTHANGQWAQSDCALCHTAHVVAQPGVLVLLAAFGAAIAARVLWVQPRPCPQRFVTFSLFTRPPPVVPAFA